MLSQEPNIISQVLGFAGKQSWWLVSCKWKFGHTGERLPKDPRLGGTSTRVFSTVQITSCWCQCKDPVEGSPLDFGKPPSLKSLSQTLLPSHHCLS